MRAQSRGIAQTVIVTLGGRGALIASGLQVWRVVPPKVEVASKVGAGDSFVAGLVLQLAEGRVLEEACRYAMAAAASAVTTPATQLCERAGTERYFEAVTSTPS